MKQILVTIFCSLVAMQSFSQCNNCCQRMNEKRTLVSMYGKYDLYELSGVGVLVQFRGIYRPGYLNPYFGFEFNQKSSGIQAGFKHNLRPYRKADRCFKFQLITGLSYLYRFNITVGGTKEHLVHDMFEENRKMLAGVRFGPSIEIGFLSLWVTCNPIISWNPKKPLVWKDNVYYYIGAEAGIGIHIPYYKN